MRDAPNPDSAQKTDLATMTSQRSGWLRWVVIALVVIALGVGYWWRTSHQAPPTGGDTATAGKKGGRFDPTKTVIPVAPAAARAVDMPVRVSALGTVTARSTVTVKARVDGLLQSVNFREGQLVRAGQVLAEIDSKPFEVLLLQAQGQLERDQAQVINAQNDLKRYRALLAQDSIASQQVDNQEYLVRQLEATVVSDRAAVESARLNLGYTKITAPTAGRVGLRQVDAGNMIHAADTNGLVVITEVDPITVIFPIPQDRLPEVIAQLQAGAKMSVDAFDRDGRTKLATGTLITADNVIDTTTGTVKLKAEFPNKDGALFPNQFVNARLLVRTQKDTIAVPTSSVQRGAPGTFVYVIKNDNTVSVRVVKIGATDGDLTAITDGLTAGERVVADGADKLRDGARIEIPDASAPAKNGGGGDRKNGARRKDGSDSGAGGPGAASGQVTPAQTAPAPADATKDAGK